MLVIKKSVRACHWPAVLAITIQLERATGFAMSFCTAAISAMSARRSHQVFATTAQRLLFFENRNRRALAYTRHQAQEAAI